MRFVDLSTTITQSPPETPEFLRTEIDYTDHAGGAATIEQLFGIGPDLLRDGEGWAVEEFRRFGTHNSTHVDAPWHYNSSIQGEPALTIDELPLEWFFAPGVVLDFSARADGEAVTARDAEAELAAHRPRPPAAGHRARAHRPRRLLHGARLHDPRAGRDRRGHALAV